MHLRPLDLLPGKHVHVYPAEEVTRRDPREAPPREGGLTHGQVDAIWRSVVRMYETGLHPAISLCIRRHGVPVLHRSIGHVRGNAPGAPRGVAREVARPETLFNIFSCSKAVTAMLVMLLDERRALHVDDPVVEYIPEFGRHGKERITIRHLITHRAGIHLVPEGHLRVELLRDWSAIIGMLCDAEPLSAPGRTAAYHALTGGFVLGEIIRRVTGRDARAFLQREVCDPLGFRSFNFGIDGARLGEVAENAATGLQAVPLVSTALERVVGLPLGDVIEASNDERFLEAIVPAGNIVCSADEACRFYELLLRGGELGGVRIFERRTIRRAVGEQSYPAIDSFLGLPVRYGMGFVLGGGVAPFGPDSEHAFGHLGFTSVLTYADPARDISVCLMNSGKPLVTPGQLYWLAVPREIALSCPRV